MTNSTETGGDYQWGTTSASPIGPGVPVTFDLIPFSLSGADQQITLFTFGTNIAVSWLAYAEVDTYQLIISLTDDSSTGDEVKVGAETSYVFSDLQEDTTYYIDIAGLDSSGNSVLIPYALVSTTTATALSDTRYSKPSVSKKGATAVIVNWTIGDDADYIDRFSLKLKLKNKTVKTYKNIAADAVSKKLKKLKPGKKYTVQLRAAYTTDETTKWSKAVSFKTKSE